MKQVASGCYKCAGDKLPPENGPRIDEHHHIGPGPARTPRCRHVSVYLDGQYEDLAVQVYEGAKGEGWALRSQRTANGRLRRCDCDGYSLWLELVMGDVSVVDDGK